MFGASQFVSKLPKQLVNMDEVDASLPVIRVSSAARTDGLTLWVSDCSAAESQGENTRGHVTLLNRTIPPTPLTGPGPPGGLCPRGPALRSSLRAVRPARV